MTTGLTFSMKYSDEVIDLSYNWVDHLSQGETLDGEATITTTAGLVIASHSTEGTVTTFRVSGGTGGKGKIDLLIGVSTGETYGQRLYIPVEKRP